MKKSWGFSAFSYKEHKWLKHMIDFYIAFTLIRILFSAANKIYDLGDESLSLFVQYHFLKTNF